MLRSQAIGTEPSAFANLIPLTGGLLRVALERTVLSFAEQTRIFAFGFELGRFGVLCFSQVCSSSSRLFEILEPFETILVIGIVTILAAMRVAILV